MTADDRDLLEQNQHLQGPTLLGAPILLGAMKRIPVCAVCPSARWYRIADKAGAERLECFCTEFRGVMYGVKEEAVMSCDARTDALDRRQPDGASAG
ncbi:hypothetical protein [Sphingomonas echinoides]|uniref:Uncharacterized protein n=1 Tax=Sphingomonas echinoides TaxID=59803 RepID=A0ABU4PI91_9SPHN|nr:hypothetical protein [Sphingomonas echinoides]MDX5983689.1 hypothetical protein [Sphingomonas echinoides]